MRDDESGKDHVNATQRQLVQSQAEAGPPFCPGLEVAPKPLVSSATSAGGPEEAYSASQRSDYPGVTIPLFSAAFLPPRCLGSLGKVTRFHTVSLSMRGGFFPSRKLSPEGRWKGA